MVKCLIIDDDPLIVDLLKHFCSKQNWIGSCLSVEDGNQALQALVNQNFDLIFLDYNLPDLKGQKILDLMAHKTPTIMVTSEEKFASTSYEYDQIIDFIVKPISYERFLKAVLRFQRKNVAIQPTQPTEVISERLFVKDGTKTVLINTPEIRYIKSEANYVVFYLMDKKVMSLMSLKKLELELPSYFLRIHKSFIINLNFLVSVSTEECLVGDTEIPIGPTYKTIIHDVLDNWAK